MHRLCGFASLEEATCRIDDHCARCLRVQNSIFFICRSNKTMPERLLLTGGPEEAAAQLIADLERCGLMKRQPDETKERKKLAEENLASLNRVLAECEELKRKNAILEGQVGVLLKLNAESARPNVGGGRRGRARRGNMDMISEDAVP